MPSIKPAPTYYLTYVTTHTPRNKYQIEVLDHFGKFDRVIICDPEEYQKDIQEFCDDLFKKYPKCTRGILEPFWIGPGEDFEYKITFSGLVLINIDFFKISSFMRVEQRISINNAFSHSWGIVRRSTSVSFQPVSALFDLTK